MKKYESSNFKFRFEGERPDSIFQDQIRQPRGEMAGRRMVIFSIFALLIVGVTVVFVYMDIKKRFTSLQVTGSAGVEKSNEKASIQSFLPFPFNRQNLKRPLQN